MDNPVKTVALTKVLTSLGFEQRVKGSHAIFTNKNDGTILTLPIDRQEVPSIYLKAMFTQIVGHGLMSEEDLMKQLKN